MCQHVIPVSTCSVMSVIRRNPNSEIESGISDVLVRKLVATVAKLKSQIVEKDDVIGVLQEKVQHLDRELQEKVQYLNKQALHVTELMAEKEDLVLFATKTKEKLLLLDKQQKIQECLVSQHRQWLLWQEMQGPSAQITDVSSISPTLGLRLWRRS